MAPVPDAIHDLTETSRHMARRLKAISSNRIELLAIELQEERDCIHYTGMLALAVTALGLLAGMTMTAAIVIGLWTTSPVIVLLILTSLYLAVALITYRILSTHLQRWQSFSDTIAEFRKDQFLAQELMP